MPEAVSVKFDSLTGLWFSMVGNGQRDRQTLTQYDIIIIIIIIIIYNFENFKKTRGRIQKDTVYSDSFYINPLFLGSVSSPVLLLIAWCKLICLAENCFHLRHCCMGNCFHLRPYRSWQFWLAWKIRCVYINIMASVHPPVHGKNFLRCLFLRDCRLDLCNMIATIEL